MSSAKARKGQRELLTLKVQARQLDDEKRSLEETLKRTQEKYTEETLAAMDLKQSLEQERTKNQLLAEQLQQQQEKNAKTSASPEVKVSKSNIQAR